jgi:hypothetical protein
MILHFFRGSLGISLNFVEEINDRQHQRVKQDPVKETICGMRIYFHVLTTFALSAGGA